MNQIPWPLAPILIFLFVFFCVPLAIVFCMSFVSRGLYGGVEWVWTISNYVRLVDPLYWNIYLRSFGLALLTTSLCLAIGFPLAYSIARAPARTQPLWLLLVMIPFWTNFLVRTYAWMIILRTEGLVNTALMESGIMTEPLELLYTNFAVLLGLIYGYVPFMILSLYIAIDRIPLALEDAARDLYAHGWTVVRRVVIPLAKPGILVGCVLVFIPSLGAFITPHLLGGGQSMMLGTLIQHEFLVVRDWPFGSALSFVLMMVVLVGFWGISKRKGMWGT